MHLGLGAVGQEAAAAALQLGLQRRRDDALLAGHERLEAVACHVGRVVLVVGADLGVEHVGALEELGVGGPGLQRGDRHAGVLELVAQRQRERLHERLRRVVDGLEGAGHRRGDRRREQDAALVAADHVADHVLGEVDGGTAVEIDDPQLVVQRRVGGERAARADAGVERGGGQWPSLRTHAGVELIDAAVAREVDLDGLHGGAEPLELGRGGTDVVVLRGDDEVEAVLGELLGELPADPAGGPGDKGEWACLSGHGRPFPRLQLRTPDWAGVHREGGPHDRAPGGRTPMTQPRARKLVNRLKTRLERRHSPVSHDQDTTPFGDAIRDYWHRESLSFSIPAHVAGRRVVPDAARWAGMEAFRADLPLSHGLDTRDRAWAVQQTPQELFAEAVGADQTLFSTNGSSMSAHVAMMTVPARARPSSWRATGTSRPSPAWS